MNYVSKLALRWLAVVTFAMPIAAQAAPIELFVPFAGAGSMQITGDTGSWRGNIVQESFPAVPAPLSLVSAVDFQIDANAKSLLGTFEFTRMTDMSSIFGQVSGSFFDLDTLTAGGQFSIDYTILGGSGAFADSTGFGLSFVDFDASLNRFSEAGALLINLPELATVPEPATLVLVGAALFGIVRQQRKVGVKSA